MRSQSPNLVSRGLEVVILCAILGSIFLQQNCILGADAARYNYGVARFVDKISRICLLKSFGVTGSLINVAELFTVSGNKPTDAMRRRCWTIQWARLYNDTAAPTNVQLTSSSLFSVIANTAFRISVWNATASDIVTVSAANAIPRRGVVLDGMPSTSPLLYPVDTLDPSQSVDVLKAVSADTVDTSLSIDSNAFSAVLDFYTQAPLNKGANAQIVITLDPTNLKGPLWRVTYMVHRQILGTNPGFSLLAFTATFLQSSSALITDFGEDIPASIDDDTVSLRRLLGVDPELGLRRKDLSSRRELLTSLADSVRLVAASVRCTLIVPRPSYCVPSYRTYPACLYRCF